MVYSRKFKNGMNNRLLVILIALLAIVFIVACQPQSQSLPEVEQVSTPQSPAEMTNMAELATPLPTRPPFQPGELVPYTFKTGDNLPALASRFNTTIDEIRAANPIIPEDVTTLPPGMPMQIPIYYAPLWGSPYQIIPDSLYVNGPAQQGFDTKAFVESQPGWLRNYQEYAADANRSGAEIVDLVAQNFSISPSLLLALLEYQAQALSQAERPADGTDYVLGYVDQQHRGLYMQLVWAANILNNGYYPWRSGEFQMIVHPDGTRERPDPWQNAATVALQYYYSLIYPVDLYNQAINADGVASSYRQLFGDPWQADVPHIPGSLRQPDLRLPFEFGKVWAFTGGPHTGWGVGPPLAALDFAPPSVVGGCIPTGEWATAVASGKVVRSNEGVVVLDLDGDGDERTGWVIFYLHLANEDRVPVGANLTVGDPMGHPSCEGGSSTGTHVHLARKYNGEWILSEGPLAFNLEGWLAKNGAQPYLGSLTRYGKTVVACECSNASSFITSGAIDPTAQPTP